MNFFGTIYYTFALKLMLIQHKIYNIDAETSPSNGAIWDEFSEQYQH